MIVTYHPIIIRMGSQSKTCVLSQTVVHKVILQLRTGTWIQAKPGNVREVPLRKGVFHPDLINCNLSSSILQQRSYRMHEVILIIFNLRHIPL